MNLFKSTDSINDERIKNIKNSLYREAYFVALGIALLSIIFKFYLYGIQTSLVVVELLIITVSMVYYGLRTAYSGLYLDEVEIHDRTSKLPLRMKNLLIGLISGVIIAVFFGLRSSILYGDSSTRVWYFFLVFFASLMIYVPFFMIVMGLTDTILRKLSKKQPPEDEE